MALIIKKPKHAFTRIPLGILLIFLFAVSPVIIGLVGSWITEMRAGEPCNEANCFWGAFGWYIFLTLPIAGLLFISFVIIVIRDTLQNSKHS